jgi:hypothetical protein
MDPSVDWLFQAAQDHVQAEWTVVRGAPDGLTILILIAALLIYLSLRSRYNRIIEIQSATIEMLKQKAEPSPRSRRSASR